MNRRSALLLIATALPLGACAGSRVDVTVLDAAYRAPYTLSSGDRLRIIVFGQDNLSNIYAIDGAGRIAMPLIGPVSVLGLTTQAAAKMIEGRLRDGFIREPRVTVEIEGYRPFFILGEVITSGQFAFVNALNVQNAVAIAGGFTPRALRSEVELTRRIGNQAVTAVVPMTYPVRPGDTIVVKERWF